MRPLPDVWSQTLLVPGVAVLCLVALLALALRRRRAGPGWRRAARGLAATLVLALGYLVLEGTFVLCLDTTDANAVSLLARRWFLRHAGAPNRLGLRDRELPPGPLTAVVLGDSFVWGNGIADREERVSERLQARLAARLGRAATVANCAYPGFGTAEELELYARLRAVHPRVQVLVHVYVFNDIALPDPPEGLRFPQPPGWLGLLGGSYSLDFLFWRWAAATDPAVRQLLDRTAAAYRDPALLAAHEATLDRLRALAEADGTRYLLVAWPYHLAGDAFDPAYAWLADYAARRGVALLDLRASFAGVAPGELTVGRFDHHPNARAHALAADAICAELERRWGGELR